METLATIGFTKKDLRTFVDLLKHEGVTKVVDIRLRNTSQLAGFAKRDDLAYIMQLCGIEYEHVPDLAPTDELLDDYHKTKNWAEYEQRYLALLEQRDPMGILKQIADGHVAVCLLCTEDTPDRCHRRLVAEYAQKQLSNIELKHL